MNEAWELKKNEWLNNRRKKSKGKNKQIENSPESECKMIGINCGSEKICNEQTE